MSSSLTHTLSLTYTHTHSPFDFPLLRYPSHLKQVFHVKSLHYGHIAKSFALREAPSDVDQSGKPVSKAAQDKANKADAQRKRTSEEKKRRKESRVHNNEHGSGGSMSGPKPKKRRKNH